MPFVYFIHEEGNVNTFKIGKTDNHPADRLDQLQTGNPRRLMIYRWIWCSDNSTAEEYLHRVFNNVRIRGEWFHVTTEQIDVECAVISSSSVEIRISAAWEPYSDEDRLKVKKERLANGKYRGKTDPVTAAQSRRNYTDHKYLEHTINRFSDEQ